MGTFRIAVSIGLFENFHRATIFKQSKRVMPRVPSKPGTPSLIKTSAGLSVESEEGTADSVQVQEWQLFREVLACTRVMQLW
jgi:hypothetical protein